jgi:hypothetical protein
VDILKKTGEERTEPLILCAKVHASGSLPGEGDAEGADAPAGGNNAYVLLPEGMHQAVKVAREQHELLARPSAGDCADKTVELVDSGRNEKAREARIVFRVAEQLMQAEQYELARQRFRTLIQEYPDYPETRQARELLQTARQKAGRTALQKARAAYEEGEYGRARRLAEGLDRKYPDLEELARQGRELAQRAAGQLRALEQKQRYCDLCRQLRESLQKGNVPRTRELLAHLAEEFAHYEPGEELKGPQEVEEEVEERVEELEREFRKDIMVLRFHVQNGNEREAVQKYREMDQAFSGHPDLARIRDRMVERGWLREAGHNG